MLAILRVIDQHRSDGLDEAHVSTKIDKGAFKIIYVCVLWSRTELF